MKKILIFLITFLGINLFSTTLVNADSFSFYEGEYIDGIYVTKAKDGVRYYQKARYFRLVGDNTPAYCIEPFSMFNEAGNYERSLTAKNLSEDQIRRIKDIIHFGYQYKDHQDDKWYAITQFMVWQAADSTGDYYFTDGLDGNRITRFESEISQINSLINDYYKLPSIANAHSEIVENQEITLIDQNNVLSNYQTDSPNATIKSNKLIIKNLKEGNYKINLYRKENITNHLPFFYHSDTSQNMATYGDLEQINIALTVKVTKTKLEITKIDSDTKTTTPSGEASLIGAKYQLLDANKNKITELEIDDDKMASIENLTFGTYYIQEIKAGVGYQLDPNIYEIHITKDNPTIKLSLENKVIKKKVELHKHFGDETNLKFEEGISFDIYDSNNNLYDTITTDEKGNASTTLPYGKYTFKQRNTTDGYQSVEDFEIKVTNTNTEIKELYDYKIKVPNTYHNNHSHISFLLLFILELIYVKKIILC